ncbi:MAG TPA: response regulator transcription factor [Solirubrobacteraceae bacterium]|nr:response regulator transcription factor [Solirubrobacteraceae bacterium]
MKYPGRPRVLIADGHEHYRSGLVRAIATHPMLRLGAVADDGLVALSLILSERPDVAVLDVRLAGLDGFAISQRLSCEQPRPTTRVVLLAAVPDRAQRTRALALGAVGPLSKDVSRWEICDAVITAWHAIADGGVRSERGFGDRVPHSIDGRVRVTHERWPPSPSR